MKEEEKIRALLEKIKQERRHPLDTKEINEHQRRMDFIVNEKIEKLRKARIGRQSALSYDFSKYHNSFHDIIEQQEKAQREELLRKDAAIVKVREQMENYEKIVFEQHKPKISAKKRTELQQKIMSLKTSPREPKQIEVIPGKPFSLHTEERKIIWPDNPLRPKEAKKKEGKVIDWLKEQRYKNNESTYRSRTIDLPEIKQHYT